jgi:hypothetical protein
VSIHYDYESQTSGQTSPNYFAVMVLLIVYVSFVSGIISTISVDLATDLFLCKTEMIIIGLLSFFLLLVAQVKGFFAQYFWDEKGIWQTHLIIPGKKYITWQEALIDNDDFGGFLITNQKGVSIKVYDRFYLARIAGLRKVIVARQLSQVLEYNQELKEKTLCLYDEDGYEAFVYLDKIYLNGKGYSRNNLRFVWEANDGPWPALLTLGFENQEITIRIRDEKKEEFLSLLKRTNPDLKLLNVSVYRSCHKHQLTDKEKQFARRQMRNWNWRYLKLLAIPLIFSMIFHFLGDIQSIYGFETPRWIMWCFSASLMCFIVYIFMWQRDI